MDDIEVCMCGGGYRGVYVWRRIYRCVCVEEDIEVCLARDLRTSCLYYIDHCG